MGSTQTQRVSRCRRMLRLNGMAAHPAAVTAAEAVCKKGLLLLSTDFSGYSTMHTGLWIWQLLCLQPCSRSSLWRFTEHHAYRDPPSGNLTRESRERAAAHLGQAIGICWWNAQVCVALSNPASAPITAGCTPASGGGKGGGKGLIIAVGSHG